MKTLNSLKILSAATLVLGCCLILSAQTPMSTLSSAGNADDEYTLTRSVKEGRGIPMAWKSAAVTKANLKEGVVKISEIRISAEMSMTVGKPGKDQTPATLTFKRISGLSEILGTGNTFDTDDADTLKTEDGGASYIGIVRMADWQATIDALGRCSKLMPDAKVTKALGEAFADLKDTRTKLVTDMMARIAVDPHAYLPQGPVKEGDVWHVKKKAMYMQADGTPMMLDETSECTLLKVEGGKAAKIQIAGKCVVPNADAKSLSEYDLTGAMRVNLGENHSLRWRVQLVGRTTNPETGKELVNQTIVNEGLLGDDAATPASKAATSPVVAPTTAASR